MASIYVNHSKNGLYVAVETNEVVNFKNYNVEPTHHVITRNDIIRALNIAASFLRCYVDSQQGEMDSTKNAYHKIKHHFKDYCDTHYGVSSQVHRMTFLRKMMKTGLCNEDRSRLFLKLISQMYNKEDYNFVIWSTNRHGEEDMAMTFKEDEGMKYIQNKMNSSDTFQDIKIENIKHHDLEEKVSNIEDAYYGGAEFGPWFSKFLTEMSEKNPGIFFKKMEDGVPFGLWLLAKTIENENNKLMIFLRRIIGKIMFDDEHIFSA